MKQFLVLLLALVQVFTLTAQYKITITPPVSGKEYTCRIDPNPTLFTNQDLVTWIFPDGQYRQQEVKLDNQNNVVTGTNIVQWSPYKQIPGNLTITAYVAKKGGTGNPPKIVSETSNDPWGITASVPDAFYFPSTQDWEINRTWEFSPVDENFLVFSHKNMNIDACVGGNTRFSLYLDPAQVDYTGMQAFNQESVNTTTTPAGKTALDITNLQSTSYHNHVFLKLKSKTQRGEIIRIDAVNHCLPNQDTIRLAYQTAGGPHDPNRKTVNISKICLNQPAIKLTYSIQFHNDGDGPVKNVRVTDVFAPELDPGTFGNNTGGTVDNSIQNTRIITFSGIELPGLGQTNPIYGYDQTVYRFAFDIDTRANFNTAFFNNAEIFFYNDSVAFPRLYTNDEYVYTDSVDCFVSAVEPASPVDDLKLSPNPFQDHTGISFNLLENSRLNLDVLNLNGRLIKTLASGEYPAGPQQFVWNSAAAPPGIYLLFLRTENGYLAKRMVKCR